MDGKLNSSGREPLVYVSYLFAGRNDDYSPILLPLNIKPDLFPSPCYRRIKLVNRRCAALFFVVLGLAAILSSCASDSPPKKSEVPIQPVQTAPQQTIDVAQYTPQERKIAEQKPLAWIEEQPRISVEAFEYELSRKGGHVPGRYKTLESKKELLGKMLDFETIAYKAEQLGYGDDPEVERARRAKMVEIYLDDLRRDARNQPKLTEEEIRAYYAAHIDRYAKPEKRRASLIEFKKSSRDNSDARKKADAALAELSSNPTPDRFREFAIELSDDEKSKSNGGDLGWLANGEKSADVPAIVWAAIWSMSARGGLSEVIEGESAFYIVMLTGVKTFPSKSFEDARDGIRFELANQKMNDAYNSHIASLKKDLKIKIDESLLDSIVAPGDKRKPETGPPSFPVGPPGP